MYVREVVRHIEKLISNGLDDDKLPSEPAFAREIGCSLMTVRRAIKELRDRGVVVTRHGYGTYLHGTDLPVDPNDSRPTWILLVERIERMIDDGEIKDKLPPYRQLAEDLGVSEVPTLKALAVLRERGVIYTVARSGRKNGNYVTQ